MIALASLMIHKSHSEEEKMREILFRGKDIVGNWYAGNLAVIKKDFHNGTWTVKAGSYISNECGSPFAYQIRPETVGQFTGLTDKNGKKIFEGDILRFPAKDEYEKTTFIGYEVFYHDNDCADNHIGFQMNRMRFYGHLCGGECRAKLLPKYTSQMVIIGNIHDNPELLP